MDKWRMRELKALCRQYWHMPHEKRRLIRNACFLADPAEKESLLRSAIEGVPWERSGAFCCRSAFYASKARFFVELDKMLTDKDGILYKQ